MNMTEHKNESAMTTEYEKCAASSSIALRILR